LTIKYLLYFVLYKQFHHYQQIEESLLDTKKTLTYDIGNPAPGLGHTQRLGGVITGSSTAIHI
jgi:hypothetical protein